MPSIIHSNGKETAEQLLGDAAVCALGARFGGGDPRIRIEAAGRTFDTDHLANLLITIIDPVVDGPGGPAEDHGYALVCSKLEWRTAVAAAAIGSSIGTADDPALMARALRATILASLAAATKSGVLIRGHNTDLPVPGPGFIVYERWAVGGDRDTDTWYPKREFAAAHLESLAAAHQCTVVGTSVDLTAQGCSTSQAFYREVTG